MKQFYSKAEHYISTPTRGKSIDGSSNIEKPK